MMKFFHKEYTLSNEDFILKRENMGFTQEQMADYLGVSKRQIANFENGKTPIKKIYVEKISSYFIKPLHISTTSNQKNLSSGYEIDMLNVKAGAGEGVYNYEIEVIDKIVMDKAFFKTVPDPSKMKIIEVAGDSMYPTLQSGDFVIIDETKTNGIDGIYALQLHNQILIKRLQFNLNGTIEIKSDNQNYNTQTYNPKDTQVPLHIIGMKTLTIQR